VDNIQACKPIIQRFARFFCAYTGLFIDKDEEMTNENEEIAGQARNDRGTRNS
jgi:hypothetical protein